MMDDSIFRFHVFYSDSDGRRSWDTTVYAETKHDAEEFAWEGGDRPEWCERSTARTIRVA